MSHATGTVGHMMDELDPANADPTKYKVTTSRGTYLVVDTDASTAARYPNPESRPSWLDLRPVTATLPVFRVGERATLWFVSPGDSPDLWWMISAVTAIERLDEDPHSSAPERRKSPAPSI